MLYRGVKIRKLEEVTRGPELKKAPFADGPISCQNLSPSIELGKGRGRFDLQMVTKAL